TPISLTVLARGQSIVGGSVQMHYRFDGGSFASVPMVSTGPFVYSANLPAGQCDSPAEFYFSVQGSVTGSIQVPSTGPSAPYTATVGEIIVAAEDDFTTDQGWTVGAPDDDATSGIWERVNPVGTIGQPDGALFGELCFVTGQ